MAINVPVLRSEHFAFEGTKFVAIKITICVPKCREKCFAIEDTIRLPQCWSKWFAVKFALSIPKHRSKRWSE
jgi:hypothetical protein